METSRSCDVHFEIHGSGFPLMLGYPLSATAPDDAARGVLTEYLRRLTDRYRVLVMDYPARGPGNPVAASEFTVQRVCNDLLAVADAAGFDRFAWWGFSWGGLIGLQLASRSDRVAALVCGGWPPLGGPYADMLRIVRARATDAGQTSDQFVTFYESVQGWPEEEAIQRIRCPRMAFVGANDVLEIGGVKLLLAATLREHRAELEQQGWSVVEIPGRDHSIYTDAGTLVPIVKPFLDAALAST